MRWQALQDNLQRGLHVRIYYPRIFKVALQESVSRIVVDGHFYGGNITGKTVNIFVANTSIE